MTNNNENISNRISAAVNVNATKNHSGIVPPQLKKVYYCMFFSIMIVSFSLIYWLCNYTAIRETFQIILMAGFSVFLAEYVSRRYLKF